MRKTKMQKGITLIALIITIVILLILAIIAIQAVTGDGIIAHARNATTEYGKAAEDEGDLLLYYESYLSGTVGSWTQEGATLTRINADGTKTTLHIGDYVNYNEGTLTADDVTTEESGYASAQSYLPTNDLNWRVLGVNTSGQLELISDNPTNTTFYLTGGVGWQNSEITLDTVCDNLYGNGTYADSARSLDVKDIDKLSNFDKTSYGSGKLEEYENEITISWQGTAYPYCSGTNDVTGEMGDHSNGFNWFDEKTNSWKISEQSTTATKETLEVITTLRTNYYPYSIATNITTDDGFTSEEATKISNMILGESNYYSGQWLASTYISVASGYVSDSVNYGCRVLWRYW